MKSTLALLLTISISTIAFTGCNHTEKTPICGESLIHTTDEQVQSPEPNPASDFQYHTNSEQTGVFIEKYIGLSEHVIIPSHIDNLPVLSLKGVSDERAPTAIAEGVFEGQNIQTVMIPETVKIIGYKCFKDCLSLKTITIASNSSLANIIGSSFENCLKIEEIDMSSTQIKEIGSLSFRGCANLKTVIFSNTLEKIQEKAFYECSSLLEVDFPETLTDIKGGAFAFCTSLKKIAIPAKLNLTSLNEPIFHNIPNIKTVIFKEGRESITGYAFIQTDADVEMIVPSSVRNISPLPFFFNPPAQIILTFLGNAPAIVEDKDVSWLEDATICYNPKTTGWESFLWKDKCEMQPSKN